MESLQRITADVEKNKTGLTRFIVSQVPKSKAPGAPIFSGDAHFSSPAPGPPAEIVQILLLLLNALLLGLVLFL
jgi:hypothetical protein